MPYVIPPRLRTVSSLEGVQPAFTANHRWLSVAIADAHIDPYRR